MKELTDEQKARLFDAMQADGVDNWDNYQGEHYQEVMEEIEAEEQYEENYKRLEPLLEIISLSENFEVDYPAGREAGIRVTIKDDVCIEIVNWITKNFEPKKLT